MTRIVGSRVTYHAHPILALKAKTGFSRAIDAKLQGDFNARI